VLTDRHLPAPELRAAELDGEVYRLDDCFCPVDEAAGIGHRAVALRSIAPEGLIAEQLTAAWVHGALPSPPARHQFCADIRARVRPTHPGRMSVREVVIQEHEIERIGPLRVTTPLRTVVDLLRFSPVFEAAEGAIVRELMTRERLEAADCAAALMERRNLPGKREALARLERLLGDG